MKEFIQTLLIAFIPALGSFIATVIVARIQIKSLKEQNAHDLEKLMKQHEIDIENLKAKHALEMEAKERDQQHQLELQEKEHDNAMLKLQKEGENIAAAEGIKGVLNMVGNIVATPEGQKLLGDSINKAKEKNQ